MRIDTLEKTIWSQNPSDCQGTTCTYQGDAAQRLLEHMKAAKTGALVFEFTTRLGSDFKLTWELEPFEAAFDDFVAESTKRGL